MGQVTVRVGGYAIPSPARTGRKATWSPSPRGGPARRLHQAMGGSSGKRLLLLASLLLADEVHDLKVALAQAARRRRGPAARDAAAERLARIAEDRGIARTSTDAK